MRVIVTIALVCGVAIGVAAAQRLQMVRLASPEFRIEIEAVAVAP